MDSRLYCFLFREGNYKEYDAQALSDQVQALKDNGVNEFLLWNAGNDYTEGANFNPKKGENQDKDYQKDKQNK